MANVTSIEIRAQDKTQTAFRKVNSGLRGLDQQLNTTKGKMGLLNGGLGKMVGLMGGVIGIAAITGFARNLLTTADRLQKVGLQLGIPVEKLQAFQFAASQSGVNTEAMNSALKKFNINIGKAAEGFTEQVAGFENLGIAIYDTNGNLRDSPLIFEEVAEKIALMESPAQKAEAAVSLFGKAGVDLLPLLNLGAEGVRNFEKTLVDAGAIISQEAADDIAIFNDKIDILGRVLTANLAPVLVAILPAIALLAENIDLVAGFVATLAGVFIATKIWSFFVTITTAVTALNVAMLLNPFTLIATGIAAAGLVAYTYKDDMADWFGFAEDGEENLKGVNKELPKLKKVQEEIEKIEGKRLKVAEKFVKTSKKDIIPNLKLLEEGLGATKIEFVNLAGREGLGGIQLAFRSFFMNVLSDAHFYLQRTNAAIKTHFSNMKQDFEEFFMALDNIVIFEGNDVKNAFYDVMHNLEKSVNSEGINIKSAFSGVMENLEKQVNELKIQVSNIVIDVPASAFSFADTKAAVPGSIFDFTAVRKAAGAVDSLVETTIPSLVKQINSYSVGSKTVTRNASFGGTAKMAWDYTHSTLDLGRDHYLYWSDSVPNGIQHPDASNDMRYSVPSITTGRSQNVASSAPISPASRNASRGRGGTGVEVNIYDGTGQKISEYDSAIRVQITERASRNNQFSALTV